MKKSYERRLENAFIGAPVLALRPQTKLVLFSDCHRGIGNGNDNFLKNRTLYLAALRHYYQSGFLYAELGDGDELWENRSFSAIREIHSDVFFLLSLFQKEGRLYQLYGNHDLALKNCREYPHYSGLILKICDRTPTTSGTPTCLELYLTHGHQADLLNSTLWKLARFLVRYLWKPLEQLGVLDPTSAAKNYHLRRKTEKRLSDWAAKNKYHLITGHTHRPMLEGPGDYYFNTGSCIHPYSITCLELENHAATLVKWHTETRPDDSLYVKRTILAGPLSLELL
ncbi:MAG: serine/threonine protein phosphatase [Acetatifactor sp.]